MDKTDYSLLKLWPEFGRLLGWDITSPEGLSALFVAFLMVVALFFSLLSIWNYWRSKNHIWFYRKLLKNLKPEQLLDKRRDITNEALKSPSYGRLWREFDESLVHISQKNRLCNTLDASHFFNTYSLARGLTENRLLAAVPGFLTAIGVIGTFVGLQLGLGNLALDGSIDELKFGIRGMIGGASIAFLTSVWGVLISVLFNFFEKCLERNIRSSITSFQNEVDYLYPRITAEQSLSNIEDFTRQSTEKLSELDEKIGHKMQEAMREASGVIRDGMEHSLTTILGPAIEKLVENAHSGSEKALETLLERFLQGVGSAGDNQKAMMEQAAKDIAEASGGMTAGLVGFASKLDTQIENLVANNSEILSEVNTTIKKQLEDQQQQEVKRQQELTDSMSRFMTDVSSQMQQLAEQNASTMKTVQNELSQQLEGQQEHEFARQQLLQEQIKGFHGSQEKLSAGIEGVLDTQKQQGDELLAGFGTLVDRLEKLSTSHESATQSMQMASADLKATSLQLGVLSTNLKSASDKFASQLTDAVEHASTITQQNKHTAEMFVALSSELDTTRQRLDETAQTMGRASERAEAGLTAVDKHFDSLGKSLRDHVEGLETQVAGLLNDYSERVQSQTVARLNTWNEQTSTYIASMTDAVRALNDVVDEIDSKVNSRRDGNTA